MLQLKGSVPGPITPFAQTYGNVGGNAYNLIHIAGGSSEVVAGGAGQAGGNGSPPNTYGGGD